MSNKGEGGLRFSWTALTLLLTYTAAVAGATYLLTSATFSGQIDALNSRTADLMKRQLQFMEVWDQELEKGFEENLAAIRAHHKVISGIMASLIKRPPSDTTLQEQYRQLQEVFNETEDRYERALESFRKEKRRWQLLKPVS